MLEKTIRPAARVVSIFKKRERNECDNYRGISLLDIAYKIYVRIINQCLESILERGDLIQKCFYYHTNN